MSKRKRTTKPPAPIEVTDKAIKRAKAREKKQTQRQRQRERRRLAAMQEAERMEQKAENVVPRIMRMPIMTADGTMLLGARVDVVNGRPVRVDPIADSRSKMFTEDRKRAARRIQQDWHDVGAGIGVGAIDYLRTHGGGDGMGLDAGVLAQIEMRRRLDAAIAFLGAFAPSIARVVLDCIPIAVWVTEPDPQRADHRTVDEGIAWIAAGLDRLVTFYDPPATGGDVRIRVLAPGRASYEIA